MIFGKKLDYIVFTIPILLSLIMALLCSALNIEIRQVSELYFLILVLTDGIHVYLTFGLIQNDIVLKRKHKYKIYLAPILIFAGFYLIRYLTPTHIPNMLFATYTLYHFIKQQNAWYKIQTRHSAQAKVDRIINKLALHASSWGIVLISLSMEKPFGWFSKNDLPSISSDLKTPLTFLVSGILIIYITRLIFNLIKKNPVVFKEHFLIILTLFIWYTIRITPELKHSNFSLTLILAHHAVPYIFLFFVYMKGAIKKSSNKIAIAYFTCLAVAIFHFLRQYGTSLPDLSSIFGKISGIEITIWATLSVTHYYYDSFIWKGKENPNLKEIF